MKIVKPTLLQMTIFWTVLSYLMLVIGFPVPAVLTLGAILGWVTA